MGLRVDAVQDIYPLADFLAELFGASAEIVVHDIADLEHAVVYIHNGELSGRKVGDAVTDRALKIIQEGGDRGTDYVANYIGKALGDREFRSATYFIDDREGNLIGLLCVNICVSTLDDALGVLSALRFGTASPAAPPVVTPKGDGASARSLPIEETLQGDPKVTVKRIARNVLDRYPVAADRLSRSERIDVVRELENEGVFLMKGAVNIVAAELSVSAPTLYKYLQEVRS